MATAKKINEGNFKPAKGNDRFPVYSKQFNELVDVVLELEAADGVLTPTTVTASGAITSTGDTEGIGYATGAGGAVTQITDSSTAVTLNKICGQITTVALTTAAAAEEVFDVNNSVLISTDVVVASISGYSGSGTPFVTVRKTSDGIFRLVISNLHASAALDEAITINFAIIKAVNA